MTFALDDDSLYQIKIPIGFWCKSNHINSSKRFRLFYIKKLTFSISHHHFYKTYTLVHLLEHAVVLNSYIAKNIAINHKRRAAAVEVKLKNLASQLQCTSKAQRLKKKKKIDFSLFFY